jgi:carboxyl-terminal processing protease
LLPRLSSRRWASHVAAFVAGAIVAAALAAPATPRRASADRASALELLARALAYIASNYVDPVDERALVHSALAGMMQRLDAHSAFLPPDRYSEVREDTEGEYGGVGVVLSASARDVPVVTEVIGGSPAQLAGLAVGDRIVAIDGVATTGSRGAWRGTMRGRAGTPVAVDVARDGWDAPRSFALVRQRIRVAAVDARLLDGGVAHVRVRQFQHGTDAEIAAAAARLAAAAGGRLRGLELDLRGNPGGLLDQAVRVTDLFLDDGVIVTVAGRGGHTLEQPRAHAGGTRSAAAIAALPLAVLIDGDSASSAEIVAGALQDHRRAVVVGARSYGKGTVQSFIDLPDGSGLKLTTARYLTPAGRSIQGTGIAPDVEVGAAPPPSHRSAPGDRPIAGPRSPRGVATRRSPAPGGGDPQLRRAHDLVRGLAPGSPAPPATVSGADFQAHPDARRTGPRPGAAP